GFMISDRYFTDLLNPGAAMQIVANILSGLSSVLTNALLILFTVVFILLEVSSIPIKLQAAFSNPTSSLATFARIFSSVKRYLVLKTYISLATGVAVTIWLTILDRNYPILWGFVAFLFNYIPNIGSIIAAIPPLLLALINTGPVASLMVGLGYLVINVSFGNLIEPRVMGQGLGLSTLVVFVSLVFWGWVLGPVGMLLSVPLTMIVKITMESFESTRWIAILLGSKASAEAALFARIRPAADERETPGRLPGDGETQI
ncbi:MAG: AI-2E family transporter, partial [Desulfomonilia bacterium]